MQKSVKKMSNVHYFAVCKISRLDLGMIKNGNLFPSISFYTKSIHIAILYCSDKLDYLSWLFTQLHYLKYIELELMGKGENSLILSWLRILFRTNVKKLCLRMICW